MSGFPNATGIDLHQCRNKLEGTKYWRSTHRRATFKPHAYLFGTQARPSSITKNLLARIGEHGVPTMRLAVATLAMTITAFPAAAADRLPRQFFGTWLSDNQKSALRKNACQPQDSRRS